jgi:hypothetical protein
MNSLKFFADKSESIQFQYFAKFIRTVIPNLENFNWRSLFVYNDPIPLKDVAMQSVYSLAWSIFLLTCASLILRRRDLG